MPSSLLNDVRIAARSLARASGFTAAAIVTIALAIGVNTGVFSIVNGALFRDIPAPDAHELVSVYQSIDGAPERAGDVALGLFSTAEYRTYRDRSRTLAITGHSSPASALLGGDAPRQTAGLLVTCGYFDVLGERPEIGRGLVESDCAGGADPVVVLGHELWSTAFAADASVVGRTVELNRQLFTVVGVAPSGVYGGMFRAGFFAPVAAQRFLSPAANEFDNDQASWLFLIGRRTGGASLDEARAELGVISAEIDRQQPGRATTLRVARAKPLTVPPFVRGAAMGVGAVVLAAFGLILLIACANVANLLLARGTTKSKEIAVRLSLGASRARIVRELLVESTLLSIAGGALGSMLALWSFEALLAVALPTILPVGLPMLGLDVTPDFRVLGVTLALTLGTGVLFGIAPALQVSKPDLHSVMKQDVSARAGGRLQATLVAAQVALCMLLMVGAGLLLRGLQSAHTIDPGFAYQDVTVLSYDYVDDTGHDDDPAFWQRLRDEIAALPGVEAAAYAMREPLGDDYGYTPIRLSGQEEAERRLAAVNGVGTGYFGAVGVAVVRGRAFAAADFEGDARVAIVSEATARNLWPGGDPIGRTLLRRIDRDREVEVQVVGVAKDAQVVSLGTVDPYYVYEPVRRAEKLVVRSRSGFAATANAIRGVVRALDPGMPVPVYPLEANLERWRSVSGVVTTVAAALGALALVLAAVGIYGVVAYFVSARFREIGIRVALGAGRAAVLAMVLRRTLRPVAVGAALGAAAAAAASGILSGVLFGVSPLDAVGLIGSALFVLGVALAAASLAARRAARLDPMVTLRHE